MKQSNGESETFKYVLINKTINNQGKWNLNLASNYFPFSILLLTLFKKEE